MNTPTNHNQAICARIFMSDIQKEHLQKSEGKTAIVLYVVPRKNQPFGATHAVYQGIPGAKGEEHPVIGHARFYHSSTVPTELQQDLTL